MTLGKYISERGLTHEAFGKLVGASQATINRYVRGDRFPSREMVLRIQTATNGEVSVGDWYAAPEAAE
ncbi:helix-turn-helix transcriptional regulator [Mycoplana sp. BE70]|uniref:helix-turn-helix domain-containing protein n=1 Tax=Mycoplana sp. BE70 TaxID=2817775 RepID=UPI00286D3A55|nr:helix-turn-helix transcriptional regulator [Mycoplana sp. BE70]